MIVISLLLIKLIISQTVIIILTILYIIHKLRIRFRSHDSIYVVVIQYNIIVIIIEWASELYFIICSSVNKTKYDVLK